MRRVSAAKVARLTLGGLSACLVLPASRGDGMGWQESADAVVAAGHRGGEGLNLSRVDSHACSLCIQSRSCGARRGPPRTCRDRKSRIAGAVLDGCQATRCTKHKLTGLRPSTGTAVYGTVCTVVWEDGRGDPASYPISAVP